MGGGGMNAGEWEYVGVGALFDNVRFYECF